jgi:hypothetical protein
VTLQTGGALALAAASALALNWAFFVQHGEASRLPPLSLRRPVASLRSLFSSPRWLLGFFAGIGGWILYVAALALAPLSLVQATSAGGIGILALLVHRFGGVVLARREWVGVAFAVGGLVLLGVSLAGRGGAHHLVSHGSAAAVAVWMAASGAAALLVAGPLGRTLAAGAGLGVGAGLCYAAGDVGTKAAVAGGARLAFVPALLVAHGVGFVLLQLGFQRGGALATAGVATLFTNAVPIAAGMALFGDGLPGGILGAARLLAFACVIVGAALLARAPSVAPAAAPAAASVAAP